MALAPETRFIDGDVVTDTGDDILKDAPLGNMKQNVVGYDSRHA